MSVQISRRGAKVTSVGGILSMSFSGMRGLESIEKIERALRAARLEMEERLVLDGFTGDQEINVFEEE